MVISFEASISTDYWFFDSHIYVIADIVFSFIIFNFFFVSFNIDLIVVLGFCLNDFQD